MNLLIRLVLATLAACALMSCSHPAPPFEIIGEEIAGVGTLGLSPAGQQVSAVVVYFHGMDQDAEAIRSDEKHKALTEELLRNGYAVVSASADGNAFGNPASQQAYRELISAARARYGTDRVVFLAESMGGLPAVMLLGDPQVGRVSAIGAVTPVMGMPVGARSLDFVTAAWGGEVPPTADPMGWPPERLAGYKFRLYVGDQDDVIPPGATGEDFAARYGSVADVQVVQCHGGHVAENCFHGADLVTWLADIV